MPFFARLFALSIILIPGYGQAQNILRLATTTSIENSGLLSALTPVFEQRFNCRLDVLAVGTGKALALGRNGDVDVVFVHAPSAEIAFVEEGYGIGRLAVMHNDFVLVGAEADVATVKTANSTSDALQIIAAANAEFISRGDDSGTHKKERLLWRLANIHPSGAWYIQAGQGMGAVLKMADEKQAYTLTDRGTYLSLRATIELVILFENDPLLHNPYHIIAVSPEQHPQVQHQLAKHYIDFVTSSDGQAIIAAFKMKGQSLFYPSANQADTADEAQINKQTKK